MQCTTLISCCDIEIHFNNCTINDDRYICKQPICAHVYNTATVYAGNVENAEKGEKTTMAWIGETAHQIHQTAHAVQSTHKQLEVMRNITIETRQPIMPQHLAPCCPLLVCWPSQGGTPRVELGCKPAHLQQALASCTGLHGTQISVPSLSPQNKPVTHARQFMNPYKHRQPNTISTVDKERSADSLELQMTTYHDTSSTLCEFSSFVMLLVSNAGIWKSQCYRLPKTKSKEWLHRIDLKDVLRKHI